MLFICVVGDGDDDALDVEGNHCHVALGVDEVHDQLALIELEVVEELVELVEELEGVVDALLHGSFVLEFLREVLPLDCAYLGCGWRWLDLILDGHVCASRACASRCCC